MDHLCFLCLVFLILSCLFNAALWSPARKGLTLLLLLVMFIVFLLLSHVVSWVRCGTCITVSFLDFDVFLTIAKTTSKQQQNHSLKTDRRLSHRGGGVNAVYWYQIFALVSAVNSHSKIDKTKILMTNGGLMNVNSIDQPAGHIVTGDSKIITDSRIGLLYLRDLNVGFLCQ